MQSKEEKLHGLIGFQKIKKILKKCRRDFLRWHGVVAGYALIPFIPLSIDQITKIGELIVIVLWSGNKNMHAY